MSAAGSPESLSDVRQRRAARGWVLAAAAVVVAFVVLGLVSEAFSPAPQGPAGSSYATSVQGVAAWAQLLGDGGHPVSRVRRPLSSARVSSGATLVVLGADTVSSATARALDRFVSAGGHLVLGGGRPAATAAALLGGGGLRFRSRGVGTAHSVAALPETAGVRSVRTAGRGSFAGPGSGSGSFGVGRSGRAALASPGGTLLAVIGHGRGRIDLLADPSPVQNRLLATADNAQLALDLAGGSRRPVAFAEALHGYTPASGLAAFPGRWWVTIVGLALATGAWALARGRRLGPAQRPDPAPIPPRAAYVDALARALVAGRDRTALTALAQARLDPDGTGGDR